MAKAVIQHCTKSDGLVLIDFTYILKSYIYLYILIVLLYIFINRTTDMVLSISEEVFSQIALVMATFK